MEKKKEELHAYYEQNCDRTKDQTSENTQVFVCWGRSWMKKKFTLTRKSREKGGRKVEERSTIQTIIIDLSHGVHE
jgi:hypothetical protein